MSRIIRYDIYPTVLIDSYAFTTVGEIIHIRELHFVLIYN